MDGVLGQGLEVGRKGLGVGGRRQLCCEVGGIWGQKTRARDMGKGF